MIHELLVTSSGAVAGPATYVDDVFSSYIYTGSAAAKTISNGVDLLGQGGMVWTKVRGSVDSHNVQDTTRGAGIKLSTNLTSGQSTQSDSITAFNSNGYTLGADTNLQVNGSAKTYCSWTFRKAPKFFDVVAYTGDGAISRTIAHSLASAPGMVIIKRTNNTGNWFVWHRSASGEIIMNSSASASADFNNFYPAGMTTTTFGVGAVDASNTNAVGDTYIAYIFAHNASGFGSSSSDNAISCGTFATNASGGVAGEIALGYEPQFLMLKCTSATSAWIMVDTSRYLSQTAFEELDANTSAAAGLVEGGAYIYPTSTGFAIADGTLNASKTWVYVAVRRTNKPPTNGSEVFSQVLVNSSSANQTVDAGFQADLVIKDYRNLAGGAMWFDRCRGINSTTSRRLISSGSGAEVASGDIFKGEQTSINEAGIGSGYTSVDWFFKRAPEFMDIVCFKQTVSGSPYQAQSFSHGLGVIPELIISKCRSVAATTWFTSAIYALGNDKYLNLNATSQSAASGLSGGLPNPTASTASTAGQGAVGDTYVSYLFASKAGISKVGSYTGNGGSQTIDCAFSGGARFILIKRTDSAGDWYVWDSGRGIVAANDPHLSLNTTANEVTTDDSVDPSANGFIVNQVSASNINVSSATYIFLAIA